MSKISIKPSSTGTGTFTIEAPNSNYNRNFTLPDESGVVLTNNRQLGYNYIINGDFYVWQRSTTQTSSGYGSDDRWVNLNTGTTKTHSAGFFAKGEVFPDGSPTSVNFSRTVVTSVTGASNFCSKFTKLESLPLFSGKKFTLSFWAKADSNKNMAIDIVQYMGTGGSPSSHVTIPIQKVTLSSSWQRYVIVLDVPSLTGKVLGTNSDDCLWIRFWFDAGTDFNIETNFLGHQSGTFDISRVSLIDGAIDIAPSIRAATEEMRMCYRYYVNLYNASYNHSGYITTSYFYYHLPVNMRAVPTAVFSWGSLTNASYGGYSRMVDTRTFETGLNAVVSGSFSGVITLTSFSAEL